MACWPRRRQAPRRARRELFRELTFFLDLPAVAFLVADVLAAGCLVAGLAAGFTEACAAMAKPALNDATPNQRKAFRACETIWDKRNPR
ncbi:MAG: hypothetical protein L0099_12500 [Acidobacteria bacterium]|nr:hypothetical protein [Acidobacteriota bacterium]